MTTSTTENTSPVVLQVDGLKTYFETRWGTVRAVDGVSFDLKRGETLGIVGESGSGKSVTMLSLMRLIPEPPGRIVDGQILLEGQDLVQLTDKEMSEIRGSQIALIIQDPMTSPEPGVFHRKPGGRGHQNPPGTSPSAPSCSRCWTCSAR